MSHSYSVVRNVRASDPTPRLHHVSEDGAKVTATHASREQWLRAYVKMHAPR